MNKHFLFTILFCLGLALLFTSVTLGAAQAPDPTPTSEWVKPIPGVDELPPFYQTPLMTAIHIPEQAARPTSPDSALDWYRMVFQSYRDGNWEVYSANGNGLNQTNLTNYAKASDARPHLNRDINKVVFNSDRYGSADIFVIDQQIS